ncbi:class I SAM-dependent methyltransferase, partial [Candidatus Woesearchaeota archaeon]
MNNKKFFEEKAKNMGHDSYYENKDLLLKTLKEMRLKTVKTAIKRFAKNKIVADIGCGEGYVTLSYVKDVKKVVCADLSHNRLKKAEKNFKARGITNYEIRIENVEDTTFKDETFDAVMFCSTLDHVPDPIKALQELSRITKKNGYIFIELDNDIIPPFTGIRINKEMVDKKLGHYN